MRILFIPAFLIFFVRLLVAQISATPLLLCPDRIFDGEQMHSDWVVLIEGEIIRAAGPEKSLTLPPGTERIELAGLTLMPGLIEGHSHILLHPYNETSWNDQVLLESEAERVARAVNHLKASLLAGFTTLRDLGSEGAGYADVGLKTALGKGIISGPRLLVAGRAIVATGSYGPKGFAPHIDVPKGAEEADGVEKLSQVTRDQIGRGADLVKIYADYRWGPHGEAMPTFSTEEIKVVVETAASSGRPVVAHAATAEGIRRAVSAGVETIEHGDDADAAVLTLMTRRGVALCPTLAAVESIAQYRGWVKGKDPEPERIRQKKATFKAALQAGVTICAGGDVGVFPHGDNARELELMVEYGMTPLQALQSATSINARVFHLADKIGRVKAGLLADLIAVEGNPAESIRALRKVKWVMLGGKKVL